MIIILVLEDEDDEEMEIPSGYYGNDIENVILLTDGGYYGS
jgi:hypothetical protein